MADDKKRNAEKRDRHRIFPLLRLGVRFSEKERDSFQQRKLISSSSVYPSLPLFSTQQTFEFCGRHQQNELLISCCYFLHTVFPFCNASHSLTLFFRFHAFFCCIAEMEINAPSKSFLSNRRDEGKERSISLTRRYQSKNGFEKLSPDSLLILYHGFRCVLFLFLRNHGVATVNAASVCVFHLPSVSITFGLPTYNHGTTVILTIPSAKDVALVRLRHAILGYCLLGCLDTPNRQ